MAEVQEKQTRNLLLLLIHLLQFKNETEWKTKNLINSFGKILTL